jgi:hypothetical protein
VPGIILMFELVVPASLSPRRPWPSVHLSRSLRGWPAILMAVPPPEAPRDVPGLFLNVGMVVPVASVADVEIPLGTSVSFSSANSGATKSVSVTARASR